MSRSSGRWNRHWTFSARRKADVTVTHHAIALNLASVLEHTARMMPDRIAVTCGPIRMTYGELDRHATQVAAGLHALGIAPGDHVALTCPNIPSFPVAYYAILK